MYVSSVGTAHLPRAIASRVTAIVGLSDLARAHTSVAADRAQLSARLGALPVIGVPGVRSSAPSLPSVTTGTPNYPASYTPQQFWSLYNAPSANTGAGQQVAVVAEGDVSQPKADLATFENTFGLPKVTWNQINVGTPTSDTSGSDEWDLDTQYSTGFAPGVTQVNVYVSSSLTNADLITTFNRDVTDDMTKQASFSAGECELLAAASGFMNGLDPILSQAEAQGQSVFTSSGDTGSQCPAIVGVNGVPAGPELSGLEPVRDRRGRYVGAGHQPDQRDRLVRGRRRREHARDHAALPGPAGGSYLGQTRGVPDVSLDADPNSGYDVIVSGQEMVIGGTSAGAPSWNGIWARCQGAHGGALGFAGPVLYNTEPASAFYDILLGGNGLYVATPGGTT